jgi:hypothetical protein
MEKKKRLAPTAIFWLTSCMNSSPSASKSCVLHHIWIVLSDHLHQLAVGIISKPYLGVDGK